MNKKAIVILSLCIALAMILWGCNTREEQTPTDNTTLPADATESATPETTVTEPSIPGVVANPFDDETIAGDSTENAGNTENNNSGSSGSNENEKPEETKPSTGETTQPGDIPSADEVTYEEYNAMSGEEQMAFFNTFDSMEDFVAWYNAAKEKHDSEHPDIEIGDGNIDIGDIIGGGN